MLVSLSTTFVQTEVSQQLLKWLAVKFCIDTRGPQRMNQIDFVKMVNIPPNIPAKQAQAT